MRGGKSVTRHPPRPKYGRCVWPFGFQDAFPRKPKEEFQRETLSFFPERDSSFVFLFFSFHYLLINRCIGKGWGGNKGNSKLKQIWLIHNKAPRCKKRWCIVYKWKKKKCWKGRLEVKNRQSGLLIKYIFFSNFFIRFWTKEKQFGII